MSISRRSILRAGAALAAIPLMDDTSRAAVGERLFSTGSAELDRSLGGGLRLGSVLAVVGPRGSGKTAFLLRLAKANGILDSYPMGKGASDMLSIVEREDGRYVGSVMLDAAEPSTDLERANMEQVDGSRDRFLSRWFGRTRDVISTSGGLFVISVCEPVTEARRSAWASIPDYVISVEASTGSLLKMRERA